MEAAPQLQLGGSSNSGASKSGAKGGFSTNREIMARARAALSGNWGMSIIGNLLVSLLSSAFYLFFLSILLYLYFVVYAVEPNQAMDLIPAQARLAGLPIELLSTAVSTALMLGVCRFYLGIVQENEALLARLMHGFRRIFAAFFANLLRGIFIYFWTLLFIIPGIIATYRYAMTFYVLADDPTAGPLEAIRRSKQMMIGNKWKLFCLQCRFIGWFLLCLLTLGLGFFWFGPYVQASFAAFYEDVK